jgi:hypothetical protein
MIFRSAKRGGYTIQDLFHAVAVCVADFRIDQACAGLSEDDTFHGTRFLGGRYDVFG